MQSCRLALCLVASLGTGLGSMQEEEAVNVYGEQSKTWDGYHWKSHRPPCETHPLTHHLLPVEMLPVTCTPS